MIKLSCILLVLLVLSFSAGAATTFNNNGQIIADAPAWSTNGPNVSQSQALRLMPPPGSTPTMSQATAAATALGTAAAAGAFSQNFPVTGQLALAFGTQVLATGAMAMAGGPMGIALAMGSAAQAGSTGVALFKAMQGQGITAAPDGALLRTLPDDVTRGGVCAPYAACKPASLSCGGGAAWCCPDGGSAHVDYGGTQPYIVLPWNGDHANCVFYAAPPLPPSAPASVADVQNALAAVTNPARPDFPGVAGDLAAFALQNHADMAALIAATDAAALATSDAFALASPFTVQEKTTDSVGNTITKLSQNRLDVPATTGGQKPVPVVSTNTVTVTNNSPTTVTNTYNSTSSQSVIAAPVATPTATQPKAVDLCVEHPDALACSNDASLSDVSDQPLQKKDLAITLAPVGVPSLAMCPAPIVLGGGKVFDLTGVCTFLGMLKPLLLAFAWLAAGGIVFRGRPYA